MAARGMKRRWVLERVSGGDEEEAVIVEDAVEEGEVEGGEAFEGVAGGEGEADPEAFGAGASEEGAAEEVFGVKAVGEVEVADKGDGPDLIERYGVEAAGEVEEIDQRWGCGGDKAGCGEVARVKFVREGSDDDFLTHKDGGGAVARPWRGRIEAVGNDSSEKGAKG